MHIFTEGKIMNRALLAHFVLVTSTVWGNQCGSSTSEKELLNQ